ncbi:MAG: MarR family winged helix-turn-helix transcriptional regulator [Lachnospiraceae bacterium]|nr:MarR family winged helix-turn-helix transcriptional regulator [Lachnospiraceae bacterium]
MDNAVESILREGKYKKLIENALVKDVREVTGLNRIELVIVFLLYRYKDMNTLTDICHYLQMNKGHISTTMDGLSKKGYIICQRDEMDRRYIRYRITEKSGMIVKKMDSLWKELSGEIVKGISKEDLEVYNKVSGQMEDNIKRMLKNREVSG